MKRDVEAFKVVLWQWFAAETEIRCIAEGNTPDWKADGTKAAEAAAEQALAAVLEAFEAEATETPRNGMSVEGFALLRSVTEKIPMSQVQNSRDSDFP